MVKASQGGLDWGGFRAGQVFRAVSLLADGVIEESGYCRGVDADGALLLETAAGLRRILAGDVSLRAS